MKHLLVIAGTGIKFLSHMTVEAMEYIRQAGRLLFLVNDPALESWIMKTNPLAENLNDIYFRHEVRLHAYEAITEKIISELASHPLVCVVFYGHPTVYCDPGLMAARRAREEGHEALVLPGISAFDCMAADLDIDLGTGGLVFHEATLLLNQRIVPDTRCHFILWQPAVTGVLTIVRETSDNQENRHRLMRYLLQYYPGAHPVTVYVASQYPHIRPYTETIALETLDIQSIPPLATLYIPPVASPSNLL